MKASILISSHNRLNLFRRTLMSIVRRPPNIPLEVIVVDDGSDEDTFGEVRSILSGVPNIFIRFDSAEFERQTGLKKFHNNPCVTNNVAFAHSSGDLVFQQGNEVVATENCYNQMISDIPANTQYWMVMSTTYDVPPHVLDQLDKYGTNLSDKHIEGCFPWPLQSQYYRSDVTNYISLCSRSVWQELEGYDERYFGGISAEDSDFVRRARKLPGFVQKISEAVSLHQFHKGRTCYYRPPPSVITQQKWDEGVTINHAIYDSWNGTHKKPSGWPWGTIGVKEVIRNV